MPDKKPIVEMVELLREARKELKLMRTEINHIKEYMRKEEVRKTINEEIDNSFEKVNNSWW
jgi:hypothetical protein|tara:strand:- start:555 stop:737 length:183 start_codon:yes stop_codon:yes gene_type:complete